MMNCALDDLRLVRPRDGWPSDRAIAAASGADVVLDRARLYPSIPAAIADLVHVYAATARDRGMVRREVTPRQAAGEMRARLAAGEACGVLFGPERTGLLNDDITLADTVLTVPLNPGFSSLNLAQAVMIVGYEWFTAGAEAPSEIFHTGLSRPATKEELLNFFEHLEEELIRNGFLRNRESRPSMVRNLRSLFQRARLHRAGVAHLARRRHRLCRPARTRRRRRSSGKLTVSGTHSQSGRHLFIGREGRVQAMWVHGLCVVVPG